jgi:outer membrane protein assembly factor BamB
MPPPVLRSFAMLKPSHLLAATLLVAAAARAADWPTFGHDPQRSGWAVEERTLTPANVGDLELKWKVKVKSESYSLSALTIPVVADNVSTIKGIKNVVYVAGIGGTIFAVETETGEVVWSRNLPTHTTPKPGGFQGTFLCPNGITATPVIDRRTETLYELSGDGMLYGLDLGSGHPRFAPIQFVPPFSKMLSLNLSGNTIYTTLTQGCGGALSGIYAVDVTDTHHPIIREALFSNTDTAGLWGRGGPVIGTNGRVYGNTADGKFNTQSGDYSNTVISVSLRDLDGIDYFLPPNWVYLDKKDLDLGATSPTYFGWKDRNLIAAASKESVIYLLDADSLGAKDHQTALYTSPKLGNSGDICCQGLGIWGAMSTSRDAEGRTWLYVPLGGPVAPTAPRFPITNGDSPHGSVMAFVVAEDPKTQKPVLEPQWISGDFNIPDPSVIANGVLFALATGENANQNGGEGQRFKNTQPAVLRALDAHTGKELFNSGSAFSTWVHFSGLAISNGQVFAVDHDSNVYCFGLKASTKK